DSRAGGTLCRALPQAGLLPAPAPRQRHRHPRRGRRAPGAPRLAAHPMGGRRSRLGAAAPGGPVPQHVPGGARVGAVARAREVRGDADQQPAGRAPLPPPPAGGAAGARRRGVPPHGDRAHPAVGRAGPRGRGLRRGGDGGGGDGGSRGVGEAGRRARGAPQRRGAGAAGGARRGARRLRRAGHRARGAAGARAGAGDQVLRDRRPELLPVLRCGRGAGGAGARARRAEPPEPRVPRGPAARPPALRRRRGAGRRRTSGADRPQRLAQLRALPRGGRRGDRAVRGPLRAGGGGRVTATGAALRLPRPRSAALFDREAAHLAPGTQSVAPFSRLAVARGGGAVLYDVDGNRYIDLLAGAGVASLGYAHPKYVAALQRQVARVHVGSFTSEHRAALVKLLADITPGDLNRTQFYSSGAEAVEAAVRLAKSRTGHTEVIGFWGGFHGKTGGVLPVLGSSFKHALGPLMPGAYLSPY